jgi:hypothetical protein
MCCKDQANWLWRYIRISDESPFGFVDGKILRKFLEDYRLAVERRYARVNDPESYAGGSVSSW